MSEQRDVSEIKPQKEVTSQIADGMVRRSIAERLRKLWASMPGAKPVTNNQEAVNVSSKTESGPSKPSAGLKSLEELRGGGY